MIRSFCKILLFVLTIGFFVLSCNNYTLSEDQSERFVRYYPTTFFNTSEGYDVVQTSDGGFLIAGTTFRVTGENTDREILLIMTDEFGIQKDNSPVLLDNPGHDFGYRMVPVNDGYVIVGASQQGNITYGYIVKINSNGESVFNHIIGTAVQQEFRGITQSNDGGFILTGYIRETTGDRQVYLVKTDSWGLTEWERIIGFTGYNDIGEAVIEHYGRIIIAGTTTPVNTSSGNSRMLILNTNLEGKGMTEQRINGDGNLFGSDMTIDGYGDIIILGNQENTDSDMNSLYFTRLKLEGSSYELITVMNATSVGYPESLYGKSMVINSDNSLAICGWSGEGDERDILFSMVGHDLALKGSQFLGSKGDQYASGICITSDGGYAITGGVEVAGNTTSLLIKLRAY